MSRVVVTSRSSIGLLLNTCKDDLRVPTGSGRGLGASMTIVEGQDRFTIPRLETQMVAPRQDQRAEGKEP